MDTEAAANGLSVQFNFENDAFYDTDYHYSNGLQLRFITPSLNEFSIGQHIYTPENKKTKELQKHDRPYAGYLYATLARHWRQAGRLDTCELAIGVIGPSALGEEMQNGFHRVINTNRAQGWEHQLANEPAVMLSLARVWRLNPESSLENGWSWDVLPRIAASLGTPFTQAVAGVQARFGLNLPDDFGSTYMRPGSGIFLPHEHSKFSLYFFIGAEGRAMAWNSFVDGNIWRDSHSVDKKHCLVSLSAGIAADYNDWRAAYTHVYLSKEFDGQNNVQNYSSVMLGYVF